ncbi:hypothetical protein AA23498_0461 [Acetobacter nitrogenifigens DSM 23921 = NBRC 105050]|nr:hypothetical protein AA23498_0461 [Acetobacter nitrogenifigens DSM 23921 = NBRC 105050]
MCAGIHMSDIPSFPYSILWEERQVLSVANLTRQDGGDFLNIAPKAGIVTHTTAYSLRDANTALADLRAGRFGGGGGARSLTGDLSTKTHREEVFQKQYFSA